MMYPIAVAMDATPTPIATPAELAIKIVYNGEMRRFPFAGTSFQPLNDKVLEVLGLDKLTPVQLKYRDEDNDLITITTDVELKTAIVPGKLLRLEVLPVASSAPAPVTAEAQNPFFQAGESFPAPPGFQAVPPMMFPPFGGPGPCGRGRDWSKFKEEMKKKKKEMSPEEWAAFKKAKEEHKRGKEHMKGFHKLMKKGRKHGFYPGMFGPHPHPHGHRGGHHGHGFPHPRGGHHGFPHHGHGFPHGPRFGGPHPHPPHFNPTEGGDVPPVPPTGGVPPPPFAPPFGAPGFFPPHPFGHHFGHHHHPHAHGEKLIARHVKDVTVEDGTNIPAGIAFTKTWRVRNEGQPWPAGCRLTYISRLSSGDNMSGPEHVVVEGPVDSNQEIEISVPLVAPTKPGRYTGYWKMVTPDGRKFGQRLWVSIVVPSPAGSSSSDEDREADRFESLVDVVLSMGFTCKRHRVFRLLQKTNGDVDKVCAILIEKQQKKDAKAAKASARMTDC